MPTAGVWKFNITALGPLTCQVTAQSTLSFTTSLEKEEYSSTFEKVLVPISGNPVKGLNYRLNIYPSNLYRRHFADNANPSRESFPRVQKPRKQILSNPSVINNVSLPCDCAVNAAICPMT